MLALALKLLWIPYLMRNILANSLSFFNNWSQCILFASFLTSCSVGPEYHAPSKQSIQTPNVWNSHGQAIAYRQGDIKALAWWEKFHDPQLNQLMNEALANNNDLQSAMGSELEAKAAFQSVKMGWVPNFSFGGIGVSGIITNSSLTLPSNRTVNLLNDPQNYHGYNVGFIPNYTLNAFAQIKQTEIAKLSFEAKKQIMNAVRLSVVSQVAASYFSLLGFKEQLCIQKQMLSELKALKNYTEIQYHQGSVSSINVAELEEYIDKLHSQIPLTEHNIVMVSNALRTLTNKNPGAIVTGKRFSEISPNSVIPANLPSKVLENRPDVAMAEYQLKINNANIGLIKSEFFPLISLTGGATSVSFALESIFKGNLWAGQLEGAVPLLNLSLYSDIDKAKGGYYAAYYNYIGTIRRAFEQVDNALSQQSSLNQSFKDQKKALNQNLYLYKMTKSQYNNGAISYADTLFSQLSISESRLMMNGTKIQQMSNLVSVYQALGGGYQAHKQLTKVKNLGGDYDVE